jgi:hypothetical protein
MTYLLVVIEVYWNLPLPICWSLHVIFKFFSVCLIKLGSLTLNAFKLIIVFSYVGSFCPQGKLQLGPVVAHYQTVQGGLICCSFQKAAALLPYWLVSSSPRKVRHFSFVHHPQSQEISSVICHTPTLGGWVVAPPPLSVLVPCRAFPCWEYSSSPHSCSQSLVQCSTPSPLSLVDYNSIFIFSVLFRGGFSLFRSCDKLCSQGVGGGVSCGGWLLSVGSADQQRKLWNLPVGRNDMLLFSKQTLGLGSAQCGIVGFPQVSVPVCHKVQFCLMLHLLPSVGSTSQSGFWNNGVQEFWFLPIHHLGSPWEYFNSSFYRDSMIHSGKKSRFFDNTYSKHKN